MKIPAKASLIAAVVMAAYGAPAIAFTPLPEDLTRQAAAALQSASSVKADFEEIDAYPDRYKDLAQRGTATLCRPGSLRVDIHRFRRASAADPWAASGNDTASVSDGKTYSYAFLHPHSTQVKQEAATESNWRAALRAAPALAAFFAADPDHLPGQSGPAVAAPDETWQGSSFHVLQYPVKSDDGAASARAYIGGDSIIHRLVFRTVTPKGVAIKEWILRNVTLNVPAPALTFAYAPPADATLLSNSPRGTLLAEGAPAPDFTVSSADGSPLHLSDYRGKTVVLKFWATWCWPCNQSLPRDETISLANRDNGVVTLAVAIWDSQQGFDAWIKKHNYPDIQFAVDPRPQGEEIASSLYHVATTPTTYVIDPSGKIVKAISGFSGRPDELEAAIEAARAPKTASVH